MTRLGTKAPRIHIPDCHWYTNASDTPWWATSLPHFPPQTRAYNAMCSDLIPPLPQARRIGLVDNYCPERLRDEIKKSGTNSDCIARLYLGRRREGRQSRFFSLRNYPLWLDQAEQLGLPVEKYTKIMAQTLAMMHFEAKIDANDVEFVLGSPPLDREAKLVPSRKIAVLPCNTGTRGTRTIQLSEHSRPSHAQDNGAPDLALWLLDFDCCGAITMMKRVWRSRLWHSTGTILIFHVPAVNYGMYSASTTSVLEGRCSLKDRTRICRWYSSASCVLCKSRR